jgi:hypothetical protein
LFAQQTITRYSICEVCGVKAKPEAGVKLEAAVEVKAAVEVFKAAVEVEAAVEVSKPPSRCQSRCRSVKAAVEV